MPTTSVDEALDGARYVILAVPSHGLRGVLRAAAAAIPADAVLVSATKGLESQHAASHVGGGRRGSRRRSPGRRAVRTEVRVGGRARQADGARRGVERRRGRLRAVQDEFRSSYFRLYGSDDVVGVEIGAALKNIIAIAAGVVESAALGHNAMAALITRGLAEISRLSSAMGGRRETLAGLSGLGDLVLTCTGSLSRNRHVGIELGRGRPLADDSREHADGRRRRDDDGRRARAWSAARRRAADRRRDGRSAGGSRDGRATPSAV